MEKCSLITVSSDLLSSTADRRERTLEMDWKDLGIFYTNQVQEIQSALVDRSVS